MNKNNVFDRRIISAVKSFSLLIIFLFWQYIAIGLFSLLKINYKELAFLYKIIVLLVCDISFLLLIIFIYRKTLFKDFKNFFNKKLFKNMGVAISYWLIGICIMVVSNILISLINGGGMPTNEENVRRLINKVPLYMLFNVGVYAPICEELIFRKSISDYIPNKYIYCIVSGLVFGGLHIISSLSNIGGLLYIIPYGALGVIFAILYRKSDNIFSTIFVHSLHNLISFAILVIGSKLL